MKRLLYCLWFTFPILASAGISVAGLTCEFLRNPRGIETTAPRLSWKIASDQRDVVQTAYRVEVASSAAQLTLGVADLWDSGRIASDQSHLVPYGGAPLSSRQTAVWRVTAWAGDAGSATSEGSARWEMGLLRPADWQAQWIGGGDVAPVEDPLVDQWCVDVLHPTEGSPDYERMSRTQAKAITERPQRLATVRKAQPAVWLRQRFEVDAPVTRARLYSAALGYYELYLNGQKVSDRVLDPGQTDYEKRVLYNIDDLTAELAPGEHELRILLAEGWYGQSQGFFTANFRYGNPLALAQLELTQADGTRRVIATDATWEFAPSAIAKANLYSGEVVDGRRTDRDLRWAPVAGPTADQPLPERCEAQLLPPTRKVRAIPARSVVETRPGVWLFDIGENIAGWPRLRLSAPRGTAIDLKFAELMTPDNRINWGTQGRGAVGVYQHDRYIAAGQGEEFYEPRFTYHGFRYVEVSGLTQPPSVEDLTAYLVRSDVASIGHFESSDPLMNRLHETIRRTYESNLMALPSDCPIREKCGWLGDAHVTQEMTYYNYDMAAFWAKYMRDIQTTSDLEGGLPDSIVPGRRPGIPAFDWGVATILMPWQNYLHTGDRRALKQHWPYMVRFLEHGREIAQGGIIHHALGDWCDQPATLALSNTRIDGSPFNSLPATTATMHYFQAARNMAAAAQVLGETAAAEQYAAWAEETRQVINRAYYHVRGTTYGSQTGNALALAYGIPDAERVSDVADSLAEEIRFGNAGHFNVGSHGATALYYALTDHGHVKVAREIFAQETYPSYGYMFAQDATTLWENMSRYDPVTKATGKSLSHPFHGGFDHWFYGAVAGLRQDPAGVAFRELRFAPALVGLLEHAEATIETPYGRAASAWRSEGGRFIWDLQVPPNTRAHVRVPPGVTALREGDRVLPADFQLGSGIYRFAGNLAEL